MQILILLAFLILAALFFLTQQNVLKTIRPENRLMSPGQVWLQFIPLFGLYWQFVTVIRIAGSIRREMTAVEGDSILGIVDYAGIERIGRWPLLLGITYSVLFWGNALVNIFLRPVPLMVGMAISLVSMASWILYWASQACLKKKLKRVRPAF